MFFFNIKNRKTAHLPLIVYIFWTQWFGIRKQCHSTWSHLGINSGMGGNETLDQFMSGPHLFLSRPPRKGKWGMHKDSEGKHTGFNQFLKITLNTVSENLSYCLKQTNKKEFLQQDLQLISVLIKRFQSSWSKLSDNLNTVLPMLQKAITENSHFRSVKEIKIWSLVFKKCVIFWYKHCTSRNLPHNKIPPSEQSRMCEGTHYSTQLLKPGDTGTEPHSPPMIGSVNKVYLYNERQHGY